jgi:RNA polymerase sigma factor (sigma-70 family)
MATQARGVFEATHWSVVAAAGGEDGHKALEILCQTYWPSIYSYARRFGQSEEEARDCTQEFFHRLIEKKWAAQADPSRGRFRTFLICRLKGFLADEWDRKTALKRGGGQAILSLDELEIENVYQYEDALKITPDLAYDRQWALSVLKTSLDRLREECSLEGKSQIFEALKSFVGGGETLPSYTAAAAELESTEAAVKMAVSRMRRRFRELTRAEVARTVSSDADLEDEMRYLVEVLRT